MDSLISSHGNGGVQEPSHARPFRPHALWDDELERDLLALEKRYADHARHFPSDWLDYGELDPIQVHDHLVFQDRSTARSPLIRARQDGLFELVNGKVTIPAGAAWQVMLAWNASPEAVSPPWRELPYFFIAGLSPGDARYKLGQLRTHLEMRSRLFKMRRMSGQNVGSLFLSRLKAYRGWCDLSQAILKEQEPSAFSRKKRSNLPDDADGPSSLDAD